MNLEESLREAQGVEDTVWDILGGTQDSSPRRVLAYLYLSLAAEHQAAIILLIRNQLPGSALALCRAVFEIMYRSNWVAHQGSDADVESILNGDEFDFPSLGKMSEHLDAGFGGGGHFTSIKNSNWKGLNSFTHSGELQLMRRRKGDSIEPNYQPDDLASAVSLVTGSMLMCAIVVASYGDSQTQDKVMELATRYGASGEPTDPNSV